MGGVSICKFDNAGKQDLTGATIVEFEENTVQRVIDRGIYSDHPSLLGSEVHQVRFTDGVCNSIKPF